MNETNTCKWCIVLKEFCRCFCHAGDYEEGDCKDPRKIKELLSGQSN